MNRFSETIGGGDGVRMLLVTRDGSDKLYLEIHIRRDDGKWRIKRESLRHADKAKGRAYAYQVLGRLLEKRPQLAETATRGRPRTSDHGSSSAGTITLGRVVEAYEKSPTFLACTKATQRDRTTACTILLDFRDPTTKRRWRDLPAVELDNDKVTALVTAWTSGTYQHERMRKGKTGARVGRVRNALTYLRSACNWAHGVRTPTGRLVTEKVFEGITLPVELNPLQPRMEDDVLDKLLAHAAGGASARARQFRLLLLCTEAWGNRIEATLHLKPADLRFDDEQVWWDPANDKMGRGRFSYLPPDLAAELKAELERADRPETPWVFFAPHDPMAPLAYERALVWLNDGFTKLGLSRPKGFGYHSIRRKWRSDRDDQPLKAVMEEGGWASVEAAMRYAKPNKEERKAVALAGRRAR